MSWELRIALRYLTARRKQAFISVISAVAVLGVAVGVMAVLIALGLMTGLQSEIRARILGATAHVSVFRAQGASLDELAAVLDTVRRVPGVAGAARSVYGKALITTPTGAAAATLKGIVPAEERTVTEVVSKLVTGSAEALGEPGEGPPPILLGTALADSLNAGVGDVVTITSPRGRLSPVGLAAARDARARGGNCQDGPLRVRRGVGLPAGRGGAPAARRGGPHRPRRGPAQRHVRREAGRPRHPRAARAAGT